MKKLNVSFIGVGKLGQACAEMVAEVHNVVGYDIQPRTPENFKMVSRLKDAVIGQDIIFVAVETPHDPEYDGKAPTSHLPNKDFDYTVLKSVLSQINVVAESEQLIVTISTVLPGTSRRELAPLVTNAHYVYNPYLIAMGTVKWDMVNPEMIMIGTEDGDETGPAKLLSKFYQTIMQNSPRVFVGTWDECECIKVFYNTFISAKVGLVNMIQDVAEKQGNINAELVCDALAKSDRRIMGPGYMKPGMGDGGACHPRDNIALRHMAEHLGLGYDLFDAVMQSREAQAENMANKLISLSCNTLGVDNHMPIIIVGKAYKPLVPYDAGSSSMLVGWYIDNSSNYWGQALYIDEAMNESVSDDILSKPAVYLMAHNPEITYGAQLDFIKDWYHDHQVTQSDEALTVATAGGSILKFAPGSIVVDPWRKIPPIDGVRVVHYGNTRQDAPR